MKLPIQITERHQNGRVNSWVLHDRDHLIEITSQAMTRSDYTGELDDLDAYLDWLRSDLAGLEISEIEMED